jgi:hypothetical protein
MLLSHNLDHEFQVGLLEGISLRGLSQYAGLLRVRIGRLLVMYRLYVLEYMVQYQAHIRVVARKGGASLWTPFFK